jgi:hypothetical protein
VSKSADAECLPANAFLNTDVTASVGTQIRNANQSKLTFSVSIRASGQSTAISTSDSAEGWSQFGRGALGIGLTAALLAAIAIPSRRFVVRRRERGDVRAPS